MPAIISPAHPPAGAVRAITRFPLVLYRCRLGWLFGRRILVLSHRGRSSGRLYQTPLEVIHADSATGELFVMSGWGAAADWYRNLRAGPAVAVQVGLHACEPGTRLLDAFDGAAVVAAYCGKHPLLARVLARWGLREDYDGSTGQHTRLAEALPIVGLTVPPRPCRRHDR